MTDRILCVDDDPSILAAYQRGLRKQFLIDTATDGENALAAIAAKGPYAVIVSDMRMPGMDGVQLLAAVKTRSPATVRIMLTGNADQRTAVEAVNEGSIFRFLTKPCDPETLAKALTAGLEQYRLVTAEKELLEKTLSGSVKLLTDLLTLASPAAFGRASRVRRLVRAIADDMKIEKKWQLDLAAMLSQIGCLALPQTITDKLHRGQELTPEESVLFASHPSIGHDLVANIPRLEAVAEIIAYQEKSFDGSGPPSGEQKGTDIPLGSRILKAALDLDALRSGGSSDSEAVAKLVRQSRRYDPNVLVALRAITGAEEFYETRSVRIRELTGQMILAEDVQTVDGVLVVCRGHEVSPYLRERLKNYSKHTRMREPIRVLVRPDSHTVSPRASVAPAVIGSR